MSTPEYVTTVASREPDFKGIGISYTISFADKQLNILTQERDWYEQKFKQREFTFPNFRSPGIPLWFKLQEAAHSMNGRAVKQLLRQIRKHTVKNYDDLTQLERWARTARQMPGDLGGPNRHQVIKLLTRRASGNVLETMCGFNSYFAPTEKIRQVTALDFCREMLERYEYPDRTRILYNLNRVGRGEKMTFFADGQFDTIGCWGTNYLKKPAPVVAEFARILSPEGKLLILESTTEGYTDRIRRYFDPNICSNWLKDAGLKTRIMHLKDLKTVHEIGEYYLVEGKK